VTDSVDIEAHIDLARAYRDMGMLDEARSEVVLALRLRPGDTVARSLRDDIDARLRARR
jgi:hypothetical protein